MWICQPPGQPTVTIDMVLIIKHILLFLIPAASLTESNAALRNRCFIL